MAGSPPESDPDALPPSSLATAAHYLAPGGCEGPPDPDDGDGWRGHLLAPHQHRLPGRLATGPCRAVVVVLLPAIEATRPEVEFHLVD